MNENYWIVIERPETKTSELLDECRKLFNVWCYFKNKDLDKQFPPPKEKTIHKFRARVEADEELKYKSANDLEKEGVKGITLRERIILELDYFKQTGNHLDIKNITLCSGSRSSGGFAPDARWDGRFHVGTRWYGPADADDHLRSREEFSLDFEPSTLRMEDMPIITCGGCKENFKNDVYLTHNCFFSKNDSKSPKIEKLKYNNELTFLVTDVIDKLNELVDKVNGE